MSVESSTPQRSATIYVQLVLTTLIWGGTFIAGRIAVQSVGVFSVAFLRFAIAAILLLLLCWLQLGNLPRLNRSQWVGVTLMGLAGIFAYNAFFLGGLKLLPASRASLIVAFNPIAVSLGSAVFYREPLSKSKILGTLISLLGVAIVIAQGNPLNLLHTGIGLGDWLLLGCVTSWVTYTLLGKQVLRTTSPLVVTTYSCVIGALSLFPIALTENLFSTLPRITSIAALSITYMGILGTVIAFIWYSRGIQTIGASRTAIFTNLVPVSAVMMGIVFLRESLQPSLVIGGCLVIAGVILTNQAPRTQTPPTQPTQRPSNSGG
ncbi:DMT family transporter [Alkalinema sp. FACHB-956]|uniref:DMT family transporter n=1 Tax=Alkalinema sp. FACHB-956 TaxID=2692768 RepID=UPI001687BE80|nr:DMT family transporter [Alkalinema sp. FACHB-956]MBD2325255.1 DMT family transporter [Alkalinema sp. FACHB-956]